MLSPHSLTRTLATRDGVRLVRELERNGLPLGHVLAARLAPGWVIPTALGFRRVLEVSHRPSQAGQAMLNDLLDAQDGGGGFVDPEAVDGAVATAAALRAVASARGDRRFAGDRARLDDAAQRGRVALRRAQASDGWFGAAGREGAVDRRAISVLVYWLVGDEPALRGSLDVPALEAAWRDRGGPRGAGRGVTDALATDVRDLWSLAHAAAGGAASHPRAA